jgi:hypothetical protein
MILSGLKIEVYNLLYFYQTDDNHVIISAMRMKTTSISISKM